MVRKLSRQDDQKTFQRQSKPLKSYDLRGFSFYSTPKCSSYIKENGTYSATPFLFLSLGPKIYFNILKISQLY